MTPATGYTLARIAEHVGGTVEGSSDVSVTGVSGIDEAGPGDLTFVANPKYRAALDRTRAAGVLVAPDLDCPEGVSVIRVADPYAAMMRVLQLFDPGPPEVTVGLHALAAVDESAQVDESAAIGPGVCVGAGAVIGAGSRLAANVFVGTGARIGRDCYLHPGVHVGHDCVLGDRVIIQPGAVIGSDGFGYAPVDGRYLKIPQLGNVEIGDDVEIGANACLDRATMGSTRIGAGTKIDNLVQIAHNVAIAEDGVLAAQAGVAGSTRIGKGVRLGGQAGLVGHLRIGDDVSVAAQGGVIGDIPSGTSVSGYPARPHREALRVEAHVRRLPELLKRVRALESDSESEEKESS